MTCVLCMNNQRQTVLFLCWKQDELSFSFLWFLLKFRRVHRHILNIFNSIILLMVSISKSLYSYFHFLLFKPFYSSLNTMKKKKWIHSSIVCYRYFKEFMADTHQDTCTFVVFQFVPTLLLLQIFSTCVHSVTHLIGCPELKTQCLKLWKDFIGHLPMIGFWSEMSSEIVDLFWI